MAAVQNSVVSSKKKKGSRKAGARRGKTAPRKSKVADAVKAGFSLAKFSNDVLRGRTKAGLSQRDVAAEIGLTSAAIVHIEKSKAMPLVSTFARLCRKFKLKPTDYVRA